MSLSARSQLLAIAALMKEEAAARGIRNYTPKLRPSEFGYTMAIPSAATEGWASIHAALVAQALLHMRSGELASYVEKAFYFAADDGCCAEENTFFGLWRPCQLRTGDDALAPYTQPQHLPQTMPLPAAAAYATAAAMVDLASGRHAGSIVIDNTAVGGYAELHGGKLPPTCIAFAADSADTSVLAMFILGHHFNDRTDATLQVPTSSSGLAGVSGVEEQFLLTNGLGTRLPVNATAEAAAAAITLRLSIASLPQYLTLPSTVDAAAVCSTLKW